MTEKRPFGHWAAPDRKRVCRLEGYEEIFQPWNTHHVYHYLKCSILDRRRQRVEAGKGERVR